MATFKQIIRWLVNVELIADKDFLNWHTFDKGKKYSFCFLHEFAAGVLWNL